MTSPLSFVFFPVVVHAMDIVVSSVGILFVTNTSHSASNPMDQLTRGYRRVRPRAVLLRMPFLNRTPVITEARLAGSAAREGRRLGLPLLAIEVTHSGTVRPASQSAPAVCTSFTPPWTDIPRRSAKERLMQLHTYLDNVSTRRAGVPRCRALSQVGERCLAHLRARLVHGCGIHGTRAHAVS